MYPQSLVPQADAEQRGGQLKMADHLHQDARMGGPAGTGRKHYGFRRKVLYRSHRNFIVLFHQDLETQLQKIML